ncbi:hypothetical protein [Lacticaseibacillus saniviri]|uniref:Uncharacterized protein n=1 Tax=Lacticaseibacillus saniviri JCM 17471 = DSM 24301 TaxID=1293598 RepID=A0A0R2MQL6_9LACO|nr:hypothetical protein [Lacticaseibacillus saniviri]KRO15902.1 hypothetical protein IV56_GL002092 [Lacticaseibacillus saniviri JCM 17471 = DSM 24301]
MTEVEDTQQTQPTTQGQQVAPEAPVNAASLQATPNPEVPEQQAPATLTAVANGQKLAETKKAPEPVKIDRLAHNEDYVFTDENGYEWHYTFQFPGIRKMQQMLDSSRLDNGVFSEALYNEMLCENVIVAPHGLTLDDFDTRPGYKEVMTAADLFCGSRFN